ncbi:Hypothetical_protein [Hexamita inflata]|uniref:Hypothetical_protein n=1 Tax=Hexamita inflata TaxID=28002 RepID=A0AA86UED0_9EUKA|nr:Hypothetical protein HINF_LOCUS25606 [Hexamita inflata]CAI9937963.1 Hypothetical protein HINF_LOCUS25608 [Hexamita inflata]CAI9945149.1 Hypothetical protein HINF_LOCUS32794 [Hexamita inflata]
MFKCKSESLGSRCHQSNQIHSKNSSRLNHFLLGPWRQRVSQRLSSSNLTNCRSILTYFWHVTIYVCIIQYKYSLEVFFVIRGAQPQVLKKQIQSLQSKSSGFLNQHIWESQTAYYQITEALAVQTCGFNDNIEGTLNDQSVKNSQNVPSLKYLNAKNVFKLFFQKLLICYLSLQIDNQNKILKFRVRKISLEFQSIYILLQTSLNDFSEQSRKEWVIVSSIPELYVTFAEANGILSLIVMKAKQSSSNSNLLNLRRRKSSTIISELCIIKTPTNIIYEHTKLLTHQLLVRGHRLNDVPYKEQCGRLVIEQIFDKCHAFF